MGFLIQSLISNLLAEVYIVIQYKLALISTPFFKPKESRFCINLKNLSNNLI